ncbi:hypothetical protein MC885_001269 [Smutsia gigantea]|nr:hypothetical protein MC885_001269 [Smutsia gigantea]
MGASYEGGHHPPRKVPERERGRNVKPDLVGAPAVPTGTLGQSGSALLLGSHISAVGAQSPGQSLRANQTLRILAVSVAPAQTSLCLSVQTPPLHIPSPRRQLGTQVPEPR